VKPLDLSMSELKTSISINFGTLCCEQHVMQVVRLQFFGFEIAEGAWVQWSG
jgi:hypothetical protein